MWKSDTFEIHLDKRNKERLTMTTSIQVSAQDMAALVEAERVRAKLNLGPGLDSSLTSSGVAANLFSVYPSGQPTNPSQPEVWAAVSRIFNQPSSHQQQPQNFHHLQQAVREQQPSTSANAFSSDESSPPRSDTCT